MFLLPSETEMSKLSKSSSVFVKEKEMLLVLLSRRFPENKSRKNIYKDFTIFKKRKSKIRCCFAKG